jgi:hypothetical protein
MYGVYAMRYEVENRRNRAAPYITVSRHCLFSFSPPPRLRTHTVSFFHIPKSS